MKILQFSVLTLLLVTSSAGASSRNTWNAVYQPPAGWTLIHAISVTVIDNQVSFQTCDTATITGSVSQFIQAHCKGSLADVKPYDQFNSSSLLIQSSLGKKAVHSIQTLTADNSSISNTAGQLIVDLNSPFTAVSHVSVLMTSPHNPFRENRFEDTFTLIAQE